MKSSAAKRFAAATDTVKKLKFLPIGAVKDTSILIRADYKLNNRYLINILFTEGIVNYVHIHIERQSKIVARMSMKNIMEQLPPTDFIRIHRSFIIPVHRITSVQSKQIFINDQEFPVGDTYKASIFQQLTDKKE